MANITSEDYNAILKRISDNKNGAKKVVAPKITQIKKKRASGTKSDYKCKIWSILIAACDGWITEHKFHHTRKWRFDWAHKGLMVAVEYEGVYGGRSRHTGVVGYTKDASKYNSAQILGWMVLRYTASNYQELEKDLKLILSKKSLSL